MKRNPGVHVNTERFTERCTRWRSDSFFVVYTETRFRVMGIEKTLDEILITEFCQPYCVSEWYDVHYLETYGLFPGVPVIERSLV